MDSKSKNAFQKMAMSAEKKMAGKLATKSTVRSVALDDDTLLFIDELGEFMIAASGKEQASKVKKDLIKIVVKIGLLAKNEVLTKEDIDAIQQLRKKIISIVNSMITFDETPFTFEAEFLQQHFRECQKILVQVVSKHLTEKSVARANNVFDYFSSPEPLTKLFCDKSFDEIRKNLIVSLKKITDKSIL